MKLNPIKTSFSLSNKSIPTGGERDTQFSSKKALGKVGTSGERRAQQFKLEAIKK